MRTSSRNTSSGSRLCCPNCSQELAGPILEFDDEGGELYCGTCRSWVEPDSFGSDSGPSTDTAGSPHQIPRRPHLSERRRLEAELGLLGHAGQPSGSPAALNSLPDMADFHVLPDSLPGSFAGDEYEEREDEPLEPDATDEGLTISLSDLSQEDVARFEARHSPRKKRRRKAGRDTPGTDRRESFEDQTAWPATTIFDQKPVRETDDPEYWSNRKKSIERRRRNLTSQLVSLGLHALVLLILALIVLVPDRETPLDGMLLTQADSGVADEVFDNQDEAQDEDESEDSEVEPIRIETVAAADLLESKADPITGLKGIDLNLDSASGEATEEVSGAGGNQTPRNAGRSGSEWSFPLGQGLEGRKLGVRSQLAAMHGGTPASEGAVEAALVWLAHHQRPDGSWSFHHEHPRCSADCDPMGTVSSSTGATGLALLCFLGAGYTHQEGPYQENVQMALNWMTSRAVHGDLRYDRNSLAMPERHTGMYSQGIAAMALTEAYGMTDDEHLREPARDAINYIIKVQDRRSGGWRYEPHEQGDTSVLGWQVMAMISARMAGIEIPSETRTRANRFLRSVYIPRNGHFGYLSTRKVTSATTAIGNLCSLYLQSTLKRNDLDRAVDVLSALSPRAENEYANYYISQVLHHFGGKAWEDWNAVCRDFIVDTQRKGGHTSGSWDPRGPWGRSGGRLYATCIHVLTLEVYYRHLPLYRRDSFELVMDSPEERARIAKREAEKKRLERLKAAPTEPPPQPAAEPVAMVVDAPVVEPAGPPADPAEAVISGDKNQNELELPVLYIDEYPIADRWCAPIRSLFDDAMRNAVVNDRGRIVGQHLNGGFGLPLLDRGASAMMHTGGDYGWFQEGEPVHAVANGIVRLSADPAKVTLAEKGVKLSRNAMDWGSMILIEHRNEDGKNYLSLYAHLGLDRRVKVGDIVAAGQQIGTIGKKSGAINGGYEPHLHFGIREGRLIEDDSTLFIVPVENEPTRVTIDSLEQDDDRQVSVSFNGLSPEAFSLNVGGQMIVVDLKDGDYRIPSSVLWNIIPPETKLVGYTTDIGKWLDPNLFLREQGATVLPAVRFTPTWDREPTPQPNPTGTMAHEWDIAEWVRKPVAGPRLEQSKGKAVCIVAVQSSCQASSILAGPMLLDAARYFEGRKDIQLVLVQTTFTDFKRNSFAKLQKSAEALPESIAVGHVGGQKLRPAMLDEFGIRATPWTVLVDPDGEIQFSGVMTDSAELIRMVRDMMETDELRLAP